MSLVGTRPPTMDEWEKYELHHRKRLAIKPGLTGIYILLLICNCLRLLMDNFILLLSPMYSKFISLQK